MTRSDQSLARWLMFSGIVLWAGVIRLLPLLLAGDGATHYHTGGLFYAFAVAIREGGFALPASIEHYTAGGLPFAYPPLAFYAEAAALALFDAGPNSILVLNAVFSLAAVVAFGLFALAVADLRGGGWWVALLAFATLPSTYREQLPGEGLAESLGALVFILYLWQLLRVDEHHATLKTADRLLLGLALGGCVLASPGTAYAAPVVLVLWGGWRLWTSPDRRARTRVGVTFAVAVGTGVVVVSSYLLSVVGHHGVGVLVDSFLTANSYMLEIFLGVFSAFTLRGYPRMIVPAFGQFFAVWGLLYALITRRVRILVPTLFLLCMPSEGVWLSAVTLSLLAGFGWQYVVRPGLRALAESGPGYQHAAALSMTALIAIGAGLSPLFVSTIPALGGFFYADYVQPEERAALEWIAATTLPDATFVVFANEIEWFPLLAQRTALNVVFGTEWLPDARQAITVTNERLETCASVQDLQRVLEQARALYPAVFPLPDYIYIAKDETGVRGNPVADPRLIADLSTSPLYAVTFENAHVLVVAPVRAGADSVTQP